MLASAEFQILNRKLDRILAMLTPVPPKVRQIVDDHDREERRRYGELKNLSFKRQWEKMSPQTPEKIAARKVREEAAWQEMLNDGTMTAADRELVDRMSAERERKDME